MRTVWAGSLQTCVGALNHAERNKMPLNIAIHILPNMYNYTLGRRENAFKGKESLYLQKVYSIQRVFWRHAPGSSKIKLQHS